MTKVLEKPKQEDFNLLKKRGDFEVSSLQHDDVHRSSVLIGSHHGYVILSRDVDNV
jgi:hypothetical protein